jgi:hypothetical protein
VTMIRIAALFALLAVQAEAEIYLKEQFNDKVRSNGGCDECIPGERRESFFVSIGTPPTATSWHKLATYPLAFHLVSHRTVTGLDKAMDGVY